MFAPVWNVEELAGTLHQIDRLPPWKKHLVHSAVAAPLCSTYRQVLTMITLRLVNSIDHWQSLKGLAQTAALMLSALSVLTLRLLRQVRVMLLR